MLHHAVERALFPVVALAGAAAAVAGVALLVLGRTLDFAAAATLAGFGIVAWAVFHPARVDHGS